MPTTITSNGSGKCPVHGGTGSLYKCKKCGENFDINQMEADHIKAWSKGGKTVIENCQMLCIKDHKLLKNK